MYGVYRTKKIRVPDHLKGKKMKVVEEKPLNITEALENIDKSKWSKTFYKLRARFCKYWEEKYDKIPAIVWDQDGYNWNRKVNKAKADAIAYRKKNDIKAPRKKDHYETVFDHNYTTYIKWETIAPYLNGYIRQLEYSITNRDYHERQDPMLFSKYNRLQPELLFITEGQYQNGHLNGFGRRLYKDKQCQIGFWKDSEPFGKFQLYRYGTIKNGQEGIWRGWGEYPYRPVIER